MNELHIDKTHWKKYRFDEMVQNISERVEPSQTDLDMYVGLEHIDPDTLHLSRHGHPSDVEGTKLRFYKGDIIFGRRRAYQRKTVLATTDGICSAHAMVVRAKEDVVDPMFLPFLFHSKNFIDMAITISVGGLSPTINWKDISKQKFHLPPKAEQKRLAELLWAADEVVEKEKREMERMEKYIGDTISNNYKSFSRKRMKLGDLCVEKPTYGSNSPACEFDGEMRYVRITDIDDFGRLFSNEIKSTHIQDPEKYLLKENDLLIARTAVPGKSFLYEKKYGKCVYAGYLIRFKLNDAIVVPKYVFYYTLSSMYYKWINSHNKTGTVSNINAQEYSALEIPCCTMAEQLDFVNKIDGLNDVYCNCMKIFNQSKQIKQELINKVF